MHNFDTTPRGYPLPRLDRGRKYANERTKLGRERQQAVRSSQERNSKKESFGLKVITYDQLLSYLEKLRTAVELARIKRVRGIIAATLHDFTSPIKARKEQAHQRWLAKVAPSEDDLRTSNSVSRESHVPMSVKVGLATGTLLGAGLGLTNQAVEVSVAETPSHQEVIQSIDLMLVQLETNSAEFLGENYTEEQLAALTQQLIATKELLEHSGNQDIRAIDQDGLKGYFVGDMFILTEMSPRAQARDRSQGSTVVNRGDLMPIPGRLAPGYNATDKLILITPAAFQEIDGQVAFEEMVADHIQTINEAYRIAGPDSNGVIQVIRPIFFGMTTFEPAGDETTALNNLNTGVPEVMQLEEQYGADMTLVYLPSFNNACGLGNGLSPSSLGTIQYSVTAVASSCVNELYTEEHEHGHNAGAIHDEENSGTSTPIEHDGRGKVIPGVGRDFMAYPTAACVATPQMWCPVIPVFSSARYEVPGHPGVYLGEEGEADIARTLAEITSLVSQTSAEIADAGARDYSITQMVPQVIESGNPLTINGTVELMGSEVRFMTSANPEWQPVTVTDRDWSINFDSFDPNTIVYLEVNGVPYVIMAPIYTLHLPMTQVAAPAN